MKHISERSTCRGTLLPFSIQPPNARDPTHGSLSARLDKDVEPSFLQAGGSCRTCVFPDLLGWLWPLSITATRQGDLFLSVFLWLDQSDLFVPKILNLPWIDSARDKE